jgi:hypothetical protein
MKGEEDFKLAWHGHLHLQRRWMQRIIVLDISLNHFFLEEAFKILEEQEHFFFGFFKFAFLPIFTPINLKSNLKQRFTQAKVHI